MASRQKMDAPARVEAGASRAGAWALRTLRRAAWSLGKVTALVGLTAVVLGSASVMVRSSGAGEPAPAQASAWVEVNRPIQLYGLAGTEFSKLPLSYHARRHGTGGGREDVLTFGSPQTNEPFLTLSLYRTGSETVQPLSFGADLDRLGEAHGGELSRIGPPTGFATRFGAFQVADLRVVFDGAASPCLGFRSAQPQNDVLRISGLICGAADRPIGRDALACVINRIDLDSAGDDMALRSVFVEAERRRGPDCSPSRLTATGAKTTWLAANGSVPPLKGLPGHAGSSR